MVRASAEMCARHLDGICHRNDTFFIYKNELNSKHKTAKVRSGKLIFKRYYSLLKTKKKPIKMFISSTTL